MPKVLIAGASGVCGNAAMDYFAGRGWDVIGTSRRPTLSDARAQYVQADLSDAAGCGEIFGKMHDVTHVYYAALNEKDEDLRGGWSDPQQIAKNFAMLTNLFEPLIAAAKDFQHITLVHGGKAYGAHLGIKLPVPVREEQPRHPGDNFYHRQEDYIRAKQKGQNWSWTILRASTVVGPAIGANMNTLLNLLVLAALRCEAGEPLPMPEPRSPLTEMTDARLIAEAAEWAGEADAAHEEIFNIHNGDLFALHDVYPIVAADMGLELAAPGRFRMSAEIARLAHLWPGMVQRYNLRGPADLGQLLGNSVQLADVWSTSVQSGEEWNWSLTSATKLRLAGFPNCVDTHEMLHRYIREFKERRIIP